MDSKATGYIVGGLVALVVVNRIASIFADNATEKAVSASAAEFDDPQAMPELYDANLYIDAITQGIVSDAEVDAVQERISQVGGAAVSFYNSKGLLWDKEDKAVSAIASLRTWYDLALFTGLLSLSYSVVPGAYGATFLGDDDKAAIVRIVKNLRAR